MGFNRVCEEAGGGAMGDQGGAAGLPATPHAIGLPDIAAERAMNWNVDLDRGLRAPKPGYFLCFQIQTFHCGWFQRWVGSLL